MFSLIHIELLGDGVLFGFTYFGLGDRLPAFADEDWCELNIYLLIIKISLRWR